MNFTYKSKSVVINCYWKHVDLKKNFSDCEDLEKSQDIIRFEVQYLYPKTYATVAKMKRESNEKRLKFMDKLKSYDGIDWFQESVDSSKLKQMHEVFHEASSIDTMAMILKKMSNEERCSDTIDKYFEDVIKPGDYYTFDLVRRHIEARVSSWDKVVRLTNTLKMVRSCGGIKKAKESLQKSELGEFRRSLRELSQLGINPVTIPDEWGIKQIPKATPHNANTSKM